MTEPKLQRTPRFALVVAGRIKTELGVFRSRAEALTAAALYRRAAGDKAGDVVTLRRVWIAT
jgi:hypothetical protein